MKLTHLLPMPYELYLRLLAIIVFAALFLDVLSIYYREYSFTDFKDLGYRSVGPTRFEVIEKKSQHSLIIVNDNFKILSVDKIDDNQYMIYLIKTE